MKETDELATHQASRWRTVLKASVDTRSPGLQRGKRGWAAVGRPASVAAPGLLSAAKQPSTQPPSRVCVGVGVCRCRALAGRTSHPAA